MTILVVFLVVLVGASAISQQGSVIYDGHKYTFKPGFDAKAAASGEFQDVLETTGWGQLKVKTNRAFPDLVQMHAAGYLEGVMTNQRMTQTAINLFDFFFESSPPSTKLREWFIEQDRWTRAHLEAPYTSLSPFWKATAGVVAHYDGLVEGFLAANGTFPLPVPSEFVFSLLAGWGDLLDLVDAIHPERRPDWTSMTEEEAERLILRRGHCSALVKILGDFSDLFMGQSAWFTYAAMNRIYKHYFFDTTGVPARKISFSSYPGSLVSQDDFYVLDSGLVMLQTTNGILNQTLYDQVTSSSLMAWQRVRIANHLATDGKTWCELVSQHNSGTYNNQYMVIDHKIFSPGTPLPSGFMWVAEQIPGQVEYADVTDFLRLGYWPSYNVPFFRDIWVKSGYGQFGPNMSHDLAPRAQIFRRDQATVTDLESFKSLMRYNDYKVDPYSHGDPGKAICSRFDLDPKNPEPAGCYDTKVTSFRLAANLVSHAVSGPTTENKIPAFAWTKQWSKIAHEGQPEKFDFEFLTMDPKW